MQTHEASTAALLLSLSHALPNPYNPLARRARALAVRLGDGCRDRALERRAADLLAALLDASDVGMALEADGLLDSEFDA